MEGVPIVDGVTPVSGPATGGQTVTIWGGYFVPSETTVTFNGVPATNVVVGSAGLNLTAVTPANTTGPVEIVVTTLRGSGTPLSGAYTYVAPTFALTVSRTGPGTVTSDTPGITCGSTCSASVAGGTLITLTATPTPGARFLGWSGEGCTGTGTCVVTMSQARTVTAPFLWTSDAVGAFRPSEGNWYIRDLQTGTVTVQQWGTTGDVPVPGDYDGDGTTDIAVWRPVEGNWYISNSATGAVTVTQWGTTGDVPVAGDYDGDGKTDIAVWRPAEGNWYIRNSQTGTVTVQQWGAPTEIPVPGDYDGDGKTEIAVWRPAEGNWYIINSKCGSITVTQWGAGSLNDKPIK
jgi:hypothetical protein